MIDTDHRTELLAEAVSRLASLFRSLPQSKLLRSLPDGRSRAAAGHEAAVLLARAGQGVEERASGVPLWRDVPFDGVFVVGDQIAVTGHDLVVGLRGVDADEPVWGPDGRRVPAGAVADMVLREVGELRAAM
ncbi:MAG TPA: hypothetical protein VGZ32_27135 [Actinocrinis sp.]|uniref:hypothetical protein n=1 Tax=Actinocrinis sp. TaxID=1920516 RepID=UPI002DDCC9B8|nr:hypothetical protein [Actinocrinis sp.]HEV3174052.1 hypothetical protein [Actinocrinis sp.]